MSQIIDMLPPTLAIPLFLLLTFIVLLSPALLHPKRNKHDRKQPPGPRALPVIGNLHMLGAFPHRSLQSLAKTYGPIMSLQLGQVPTIVVSSPEAAERFLKTYDTVFANRPKTEATHNLSYGSKSMAFAEYGEYWRGMRKLCISELLSPSRVELFAPQRREELQLLVKSLEKAAAASEVVNFSEMVGNFVENVMFKMIFGRKKDDRFDLKGIVHEALSLFGAFNVADHVPWLTVFDFQGIRKRLQKTSRAIDELLELIIMEHEQDDSVQTKQHKDFVDILLSLMNQPMDPHKKHNLVIDRTNIKAIVLDMLAASFETPATAVDWVFSELLRHPRVMKNLQAELENVVGVSKVVEETDLPKLSYLDVVVKEALRLNPVGPLLLPRESSKDMTIEGYYIKKRSRIIVNAWAIGRDPKVWSDNAEVFCPERFINSSIDLQGHDFQLIPFGSGRRGCPAIQLGLTTVKLVVAQLVHCFNWELPPGMSPSDLDMTEKSGLSMPRANHLIAVPGCRLVKEAYNGLN